MRFVYPALVFLLAAHVSVVAEEALIDPALKPGLDAITPDGLLAHIKVLSSDEYEGRAPGSHGEELSVQYLSGEMRKLHLTPGNPDGSYIQEVPLAGILSAPQASFSVKGQTTELKFPDDYVASSAHLESEVKVENSEIVFVGYGIVAPEYHWDDYKGADVKGKTILLLINDPPVPDPKDPTKLDEKMFKGRAMTYYGRWTYKYEIAAKMGAAAAIIIHETEAAAYPYAVVRTSWSKENFELDAADKNAGMVPVRSWITLDVAKKLLSDSGQDFEALKKAALSKDFHPMVLPAKATFDVKQTVRSFKSRNVVGKLEGKDSALKDQYVIYSAHCDHLGKHPELTGDHSFNGAVDNASGDAAVLQLAAAFLKLNPPPKRSILFLCTTAEEAGLLGAKYYVEHPLYPLDKTLADINIDELNVWGKARDVVDITFGFTTMDDLLAQSAKRQGRATIPNARPEKGTVYRADNFEFSKAGVPSLYLGPGEHLVSRASDAPLRADEFDLHDYHQVSDEIKPDWDLSGAVEDVQLLFDVGCQVANGTKAPEWKPGTEFKRPRARP
jgi:Zn-dependent M28 family amino/carboxypeptidase